MKRADASPACLPAVCVVCMQSAAANPEETGGGSGLQQSMEQLLLGRIRRLETEVMAGRRKAAEAAADKAKLAGRGEAAAQPSPPPG